MQHTDTDFTYCPIRSDDSLLMASLHMENTRGNVSSACEWDMVQFEEGFVLQRFTFVVCETSRSDAASGMAGGISTGMANDLFNCASSAVGDVVDYMIFFKL